MNKKVLIIILLYWIVALMGTAFVLSSLAYSFGEALFVGMMLLPGSLSMRYFWPKTRSKERRELVRNRVFLVAGVLVGELLLILVANIVLLYFRHQIGGLPEVPELLLNPLFVLLMMVAIVAGDTMLGRWLKRRYPVVDREITFVSNRRSVTIKTAEILYAESNDTEVWIYATEGRKFRNKTPISQWENMLGEEFVRIHRSYLVNRAKIDGAEGESVAVGEARLPVSRKYRSAIEELMQGGGQ